MIETKKIIEQARYDGRRLDQMLINGRRPIIGRNLMDIEGRNRSEKYVGRLAGESSDTYRKSRTESFVEWFGATAAEDCARSELVGEFLRPLLNYSNQQTIYIEKDFWSCDQEISAMFANLRKAVVAANQMEARFFAVQVKVKVEELLRSIEKMPTF